MKKHKHATTNAAEVGKLLRILGTKKQREREPLAWYRTEHGLALRLYAGAGVYVIAGEPESVKAAQMLGLATSRASFTGRVDAILDAGAEPVHAYQAGDPLEAGEEGQRVDDPGELVAEYLLGERMIEGLAWCVKATATDAARLILQSVAVQLIPGGVRMVAGDNYRIHIATSSTEDATKAEPVQELILPRRLAAYLASRGEPVAVHYHQKRTTLTAPGLYVSAPVGEKWPDFRSVIPGASRQAGKAGTDARQIVAAVEEIGNAARVELALAGKSRDAVQLVALATGARSVELGAGAARVSVAASGSGAGAAMLNADYLREAVEGFTGEHFVAIRTSRDEGREGTTGSTSPLVFEDAGQRVAVVMPVRMDAAGTHAALVAELIEKAAGTEPAAKLRVMVCGKCGEPVEGMTAPLPGEPYQVRGTCARCGSVPAVPVHRDAVAATA